MNTEYFEYYIDKDERGEFVARVDNSNGDTVFEFGYEIFENGFMKHKTDIRGLHSYLVSLHIATSSDRVVLCN